MCHVNMLRLLNQESGIASLLYIEGTFQNPDIRNQRLGDKYSQSSMVMI